MSGKGGEFEGYLVQMPNGSWMWPNMRLWMTFSFDPADRDRLSGIRAGQRD
jgi:hypothetical protein